MKKDIRQETNFLEIMGDTPTIRLLDFLIENDRDSWNLVEIRDNINIGYSTLKILLPKLLKENIVEIKKKVGKSNLYTINRNNEIVKKIYNLYNTINRISIKALQKDLNSN